MAPWDGSGNYQLPPGTEGVPDTPIESLPYNTFIHDLRDNDLNVARPITRGGTGATTPTAALTNLGGEKAQQTVTNYDSNVWLSGSFYSDAPATASPVAGHRFVGVSIVTDVVTQANIMLEAFDLDSTPTGARYTRTKKDGAWGAWTSLTATLDTTYVKKIGDTMSGDLSIAKANPAFSLLAAAAGQSNIIAAAVAGKQRWLLYLGDGSAESGANAGSNFALTRFNDAGATIDVPFSISRSNGYVSVNQGLNIAAQTGGKVWSLFDPDSNGLQISLSGVGTIFNFNKDESVYNSQLKISRQAPQLSLNDTVAAGNGALARIISYHNAAPRWEIRLGNAQAESGSDAGSNFSLIRFSDAGTPITVLDIIRSNGAWVSQSSSYNMGPGGTGGAFADFYMNGGAGSAGGPLLGFLRNGTAKWYIATQSRLSGNNDDSLSIYSVANGAALTIDPSRNITMPGSVTISGNLSANTLQTPNWAMLSNATAAFAGVIYFGSLATSYIQGGSANSFSFVAPGGSYLNRVGPLFATGFYDSINSGAAITARAANDSNAAVWVGLASNSVNTSVIRALGQFESYSNSYGAISDRRLKTAIAPATSKLDEVMRVPIINFEFSDAKMRTALGKQIGVADDDIAAIWPGLVYQTPETPMQEWAPPGRLDPGKPVPERKPIREWTEPSHNVVKQSILFGPILMKAFQEFVNETRAAIEELRH